MLSPTINGPGEDAAGFTQSKAHHIPLSIVQIAEIQEKTLSVDDAHPDALT